MTAEDHRLGTEVYQPAEDSSLLVDAAMAVVDPRSVVVDTGTGTGFVADRLRQSIDVRVISSDINPQACRTARDRGLEVVRGSLLSFLSANSVDAALFNPPYLPADDRLDNDWLDRATTGGPLGYELVVEWIRDLPRVLRRDGIGVCLVSSRSDIDHVRTVATTNGFVVTDVAERSFGLERLVALGLRRQL